MSFLYEIPLSYKYAIVRIYELFSRLARIERRGTTKHDRKCIERLRIRIYSFYLTIIILIALANNTRMREKVITIFERTRKCIAQVLLVN